MSRNAGAEPVAIVGIGCRFPGGANSPDAFWRLLEDGVDVIRPMPPGRFDVDRFVDPEPRAPGKMVTAEGGFLDDVDLFDAAFFGISPREAVKIDPQHRLLLELAWEALEDAAIVPSALAGSRTGVYVGLWTGDYESVLCRRIDDIDLYSTYGGGRYAAAGRLSFVMDLRGPSLTLDTACSSSLVALHLGCQALRTGEADLVLAGASNLILQPYISIGYSRSGMLSPGARCRFGAVSPDGYVRSEGAAVVVLKPLDAAVRDRDPIHAVIIGSSVNSDGRGSGLLVAPSMEAQSEMLRLAYADADVSPDEVAYVEAHGTGTAAGDGVELRALGSVLGRRTNTVPLPIGSIKSLIGHTEAAAGLAGLIKAILVLRHRRVPADRNLSDRDPEIPWRELGLEIVGDPVALETGSEPLIAGVSAFGLTGTNAHVVLAEAPSVQSDRTDSGEHAARADAHVVTLSAHTPNALAESARLLRDAVSAGPDGSTSIMRLTDLSYTTTCRRAHHVHRAALVVDSESMLVDRLNELIMDEPTGGVVRGEAPPDRPRVAFVFPGQGSQWLGMGRELTTSCPAFAASVSESARALEPLVDWSIERVLAGEEPLDTIDVIQPALAAVQIALACQLIAWGVQPDAVLGHSMGEVAAAHLAGALSIEEAMRVLVLRSKLLARIAGRGAMALADEEPSLVETRIARFGDELSVAAMNGPRSTIVSGDPAAMDELLAELGAEDVFCRRVRVDVASHSSQTDPLLPRLAQGLNDLRPAATRYPFHSTVRAEAVPGEDLTAAYWAANLRQPVRLHETVRSLMADGVNVFVEIAPHPILLSSLADIAADAESRPVLVPVLRRDEPEMPRLLEAVARLHVCGVAIDWPAMAAPDARPVRLPAYPWQHERFWLDDWEDWSGNGGEAAPVEWPAEASALLYRLDWEEAPGPEASTVTPAHWLIVGRATPLADATERHLRSAGHQVATVRVDPEGSSLEEAQQTITVEGPSPAGIVLLTETSSETDLSSTLRATDTVRRLVQDLLHSSAPIRLILATVGSQALDGYAPTPEGIGGAPVWGFGRVLRDEQPELGISLVDLDPADSADASAGVLARILADPASEPDIAVRDGRCWVPRLERMAPPPTAAGRKRWPVHGATLITGGLGDLGLAVARHLVDRGVRRLVLLSRSPLPPRSQWATLDPSTRMGARVGAVLDLESKGASVHVGAVDVGDAEAVGRFLDEWKSEAWPPIVAVVHTAGVIASQLVRSLSADALRRVFHGKVGGALSLDRAFPDAERFVLFSSTSVVIPQAGEANYAAANAFLDALARERRARGQEAQVVNWGVWRGSGVIATARGARYVEEVRRQGIDAMAPEIAVRMFDRIAASDTPQAFIAPVDWDRLRETRGLSHLGRVCDRLLDDAAADGRRVRALDALASVAPAGRHAAVVSMLREIVAQVLGIAAERVRAGATFGSQGLDSLMALELRNHVEGAFQISISATVAWNYPTLGKLASHLLERVGQALPHASDEEEQRPVDRAAEKTEQSPSADAITDVSLVRSAPPDLELHVEELAAMSDAAILEELRRDA